jgi:hypothetical protein
MGLRRDGLRCPASRGSAPTRHPVERPERRAGPHRLQPLSRTNQTGAVDLLGIRLRAARDRSTGSERATARCEGGLVQHGHDLRVCEPRRGDADGLARGCRVRMHDCLDARGLPAGADRQRRKRVPGGARCRRAAARHRSGGEELRAARTTDAVGYPGMAVERARSRVCCGASGRRVVSRERWRQCAGDTAGSLA